MESGVAFVQPVGLPSEVERKGLSWPVVVSFSSCGRFNHFLAARTKALLEIKVLPCEPVFDQKGACLDPRRRMMCRLYLIEDLPATITELDRLLFHSFQTPDL
jgi:hypothetical protein